MTIKVIGFHKETKGDGQSRKKSLTMTPRVQLRESDARFETS